jgi:hypothetical protein
MAAKEGRQEGKEGVKEGGKKEREMGDCSTSTGQSRPSQSLFSNFTVRMISACAKTMLTPETSFKLHWSKVPLGIVKYKVTKNGIVKEFFG